MRTLCDAYYEEDESHTSPLKELRHGLCILKNLAYIFQVRHLQSVLIFSILSQPCSILVYKYFFGVFLSYQVNILWFPSR